MEFCKHLPVGCDCVAECKNFLTNEEIMLLLDNLSQEMHEVGEELSNFLMINPDINYSAYYYRNYRRLMTSLHSAKCELRIKNTGEDLLISDTFRV